MRMAMIKVKDQNDPVPVSPLQIVDIWKDGDSYNLRTVKDDDGWTLDMTLSEAVEEINAAMAVDIFYPHHGEHPA